MSGTSHWRDARLARALQEAPDAALQPSPAARRAILQAAARAVAPVAPVPWWRSAWPAAGQRSLPWNAAFATVALATLVTVLWREQEVPGAQPEAASAARSDGVSPAQGPTPATAAAPSAVAPPATPPAAAPAPAPAATAKAKAESAAGDAPAAPATSQRRSEPARLREQLMADRAQDLARAAADPVAPPAGELAAVPPPVVAAAAPPASAPPAAGAAPAAGSRAAATPQRSEGALSKSAPVAQGAPQADAQRSVPDAASTVASAPPLAASDAATAAAPAPLARETLAEPGLPAWDAVRLEWPDGRRVDLTRAQAGRLAPPVEQLIAAASRSDGPPSPAPAQLRVRLMQRGVAVGTLEVAQGAITWTPAGGGTRSAHPDAAVLRSLFNEVQQLAPR